MIIKTNNELDDSFLERTRVPFPVEGVGRSFIDEEPPEGGDEGAQRSRGGRSEGVSFRYYEGQSHLHSYDDYTFSLW